MKGKEEGFSPSRQDVALLNALLEGAATHRALARKLGVAPATVHHRLKRLKEAGVLLGARPVLDYPRLGYDVVALINVAIEGGHLEKIEKKYAHHRNVYAVYDVTGAFDALIIARFRSTAELNRFVKKLLAEPFVRRTNTEIALNVVKEAPGPFPL